VPDTLFDLPPIAWDVDLIYCNASWKMARVARDFGWLIGANSSKWTNAWKDKIPAAWVSFVDNDFYDYDHAVHMRCVKHNTPKYATVRDFMTEAQCAKAGITYYSFDEVLDMAAEIAGYAENVIIIPKVDVLDSIPRQYMLGFSVPSSYGGTPIPLARFAHRRVHLLGGSWQTQRAYMTRLGAACESIDLNHHWKVAAYGQIVREDGTMQDVGGLNIGARIPNVAMFAALMSFGNIAAAVHGHEPSPQQEERV
jgi:hypothetical protein